ncbi:MAG: bifunctional 3-phosphoshikimate 1-carboxyvinyltransferase/cytidylate kinase [Burkholderiaceae bacterium]|nr:bifunctional 3-phosphoshikimate 1-carboxyvinyltransferase/cytidylate kinase [Sulfuritalea sp.]MCF8175199.1 bifunctional 3-phosphoshikimate 1-carboxyvinyltransferase/cytidylate kinase [Burkholderiaceae bacterium]
MPALKLPALSRAAGSVRLPGSKSISNRMLLLAALAQGSTEIHNLLDSDDTRVMLTALEKLGVGVTALGDDIWRVEGCGGAFPVKDADLFMGNAGTAIRPLTAALALSGGAYRLSGVARMHERPIGDLVDGLRQIGADVRYTGESGFPPLAIHPANVAVAAPIRLRGDVSSQFLTALLMALPLTGEAAVIEMTTELISRPYVEITLNLMARFGVEVRRDNWQRFTIAGGQRYQSPGQLYVEGDASAASYFLAAGAIGGGPVRVEGVGKDSIQGDVRFADALEEMGATVTWGERHIEVSAPSSGKLKAFDLDLNHIPDAAMTLAVTALFADGPCRLRNIASWRVKETDRISAMATELRKLGATVEEGADYIAVTCPRNGIPGMQSPPAPIFCTDVAIDTYDDHRMAMCFSLAALSGVPVTINDPQCVNKTFPGYFDALAEIAAPVIAIDGPSASGKGTVAERVAATLGYHYLDSGSLYRLVALAAIRANTALDDEVAVAALAGGLPASFEGGRILLAGDDVSDAIRSEEISAGASKVAALPAVRSALLARQRAYRRFPGLVADGRDMASVVFPDAMAKVFLTASAEARAERRYKQLIAKEMPANMHALLQDLQDRDARDAQRSVAPLRQCDDAELVDTTQLDIEAAVATVMAHVRRSQLPSGIR